MVRNFFSFVGKEVRGMHEAAYVLAAFALLSQILALLRDRLLAASFGAGETLDLYYAAFRIPDLLFATVASLLSLYALLPVLSRFENESSMVAFVRDTLLAFFVVMGAVSGLLFIFAPVLVSLVAPGLVSPELTALTRILLLQPILLGASNIVAALTQLHHRFVLYSVSPLLYNLGIILGIVALYPYIGLQGLAWGVVLGAALHLLVQLPLLARGARGVREPLRHVFRRLRQVLALSVPRSAALAVGQVSLVVFTAIASLLPKGSIAVFTFAWNLQAVPLAIIGVSYSVAAFPTLSRFHTEGLAKEFVEHLETALRHILFWAIPATVFVIVLRAQLVRTILGAGAFDWSATRLTAAALALFIISLCAQSITLLLFRGYYAAGETFKPLLLAVLSVSVAVVSALALLAAFHGSDLWRHFFEALLRVGDLPNTGVLMLALGYCLGALAGAGAGLWAFSRDFSVSLRPLVRLALQSFAASVIGGAVAYGALAALGSYVNINTTFGIAAQGTLAGLAGLVATGALLFILGNEEIREAYRALHKRSVPAPVALEPTDVSS